MANGNDVAFGQEVGAGLEREELPAYAPMLAAYHRACARELQQMIADLPLQPGDRVLDMACGDGVYAAWLADRVGPAGTVVGVDIAPAFLDVARRNTSMSQHPEAISFQIGDINGLPFADGEFDLVWCAHSLYSLPDPLAALREMRRVTKPGGTVAILENDTLHHMLLPWPAELELAVRQAQLAALEESANQTGKFYIGRNLCGAFEAAELDACQIKTYTIDRRAPLSDDERMFLEHYLKDLQERAQPYLDDAAREALRMLLDHESSLYLLDRDDFFLSHIEIVARGIKGAA
jgi:ubiquinone/menaquinone biosynthesis C-methylase UbiE